MRAATTTPVPISRCEACAIQFSWLNLLVNLALAAFKGFIGVVSRSGALVASALYSVNDVTSAIIALISLRIARRAPSDRYPYGQGKAEFIAVGIVGVVLMFAVLLVMGYSIAHFLDGGHPPPHLIAALVAAVTLATNEFLARRGNCIAARIGSPVLLTCAEHNRADALSSGAAIVGIAAAAAGYPALDVLVAGFETLHIGWLAVTLLGHAVRGLMDASLPTHEITAVTLACEAVAGVRRVVQLRSRQAGPRAWVDIEIEIDPARDPDHSIAAASEVAARVEACVAAALMRPVTTQVKIQASQVTRPPQGTTTVRAHA